MTGERLGTIGHQEPAEKEPDWKQVLLAKPSISRRKGIAYGYNPPYEDTSTLVLTAPSGTFVDVRFELGHEPTTGKSFWAFAGMSTTTFPSVSSGAGSTVSEEVVMSYMAHCVWTHEIDSKGAGVRDEGDMILLGNGDCIEVGVMERKGTLEIYKEYWTGLPQATDRVARCVVARTIGEGMANGVIIRIGGYCQGIVQEKGSDGVSVERWLLSADEGGPDEAKWLRDWRSNTDADELVDVLLPCMWVCGEARKEGEEMVFKGSKWKLIEAFA